MHRPLLAAPLIVALTSFVAMTAIAQEKLTRRFEKAANNPLVPLPKIVPAPAVNPTTLKKVELGKLLFFDPRLSADNTISCATCHDPRKAFGDAMPRSKGAGGKTLARNSPTLLNVGFHSSFFWDGRAASLEEQALGPIQSADEMNQDLRQLEQELNAIPGYVERFQDAFQQNPNRHGIAKALASFQRTLVTGPSAFDRFLMGDKDALSSEAKQGLEIFRGESGCVRCHKGPLLSDGKYYRLGVAYRDQGRAKVTGKKEDRFRFRTPSLRNVAETGPYMHDGSLKTLDDVVMFYYRSLPVIGPEGLDPDTEVLAGQSYSEMHLLVAFLKSLSGKVPEIAPPLLPSILESERDTSISPATQDDNGFLVHTIESPYQAQQTTVKVLLPKDIENGIPRAVVYVLPVEASDQTRYGDGLVEIKKHHLHQKHGAIFVAPTFADLPWYADHPTDSKIRQESYFLNVVVPFIEKTYPTLTNRDGRLLLGFSKSGWGAWSLLLRHPDTFGRAAAWDAPMMMDQPGKYGSGPIFGTQVNFEKYQISRLLEASAAKIGTRQRLILTGFGSFRREHEQVHGWMQGHKIPHEYRDGPQRKHDWHSGWVVEAVELLFNSVNK